MLSNIGNWASIVGLAVSVFGLGFALWQLKQLRGETRAAREAAERTRREVARDLAIAEVSRVSEKIQSLKELHRQREWSRALYIYPEIRKGLIDIRVKYPELSPDEAGTLEAGVSILLEMERSAETSAVGSEIPQETVSKFNGDLNNMQLTLAGLESRLQQSPLGE
ncbi:MAG: hypothetical protein FJ316_01240 [SAR202 cluster bacterium]|nr:hypothetical protein [SAR202 cluster bacterium]